MHSSVSRPLRSGGGSSSHSVTSRSTASAPRKTNGKAPAGREAPADGLSGTTHATDGAPVEKQKRKPKKKGWKGYTMVYYDDDGNVIEERMRNETPPDERSTLPEVGLSRENTAAVSGLVTEKRPRTSSTPQPEHTTLPSSSSVAPPPVAAPPAPAEPTEPQKAQEAHDLAQPKKRRKTSPGSTAQSETSRANSTAPHPAPAQSKAPRQLNRFTGTADILAKGAVVRERKFKAASSRATPTHAVENDAPLPTLLRVGLGEGPHPTLPESYLRSEALFIIESTGRYREVVAGPGRERAAVATVNGQNGHQLGLSGSSKSSRIRLTPPLTGKPFQPAPLDSSSLDLQYDPPYRSPARPAHIAPPRPRSPDAYPDADKFVSSGPSSFRSNHRSYAQPSYPSSHGHRYSEIQKNDKEFETHFATIQDAYASTAATNGTDRCKSLIRSDDPRPPEFHEGQKHTVVLAPHATGVGQDKPRESDHYERAYIDGLQSINEEHEENIRRFVDNVRASGLPGRAHELTADERGEFIALRASVGGVGYEKEDFKWNHLRQALTDIRVVCCVWIFVKTGIVYYGDYNSLAVHPSQQKVLRSVGCILKTGSISNGRVPIEHDPASTG